MRTRSPGDSAAAGTGPACPATGPADTRYFASLAAAKYMLLTTFKRDGSPVATPVHVAVEDERAYFRTWNPSGKWKRLRHTQRVLVAPSTFRGHTSSPQFEATARLLAGAEAAAAGRALARKYPILHGLLIPPAHRIRGWQTVHYELHPPSGTGAPGGHGD